MGHFVQRTVRVRCRGTARADQTDHAAAGERCRGAGGLHLAGRAPRPPRYRQHVAGAVTAMVDNWLSDRQARPRGSDIPERLAVKELTAQLMDTRTAVVCAMNQLLDLKDLTTGTHST